MINLVPVSTDDSIREVARLAHTIWNEYFPAIIGQAQVDYMVGKFQSRAAIQSQIAEDYRYYLIQLEAENVGYIGLIPQPHQDRMQISKFYISKDHRGKGIARQVLDRIIIMAKTEAYSTLYLTVNKYNTLSIHAYERLGFVNSGGLITDIGQGYIMDDYAMSMTLPE